MLRAVAGRDRVEVGRTLLALSAVVVAGVALGQLAATRSTNQADASLQTGAIAAAKRFATGLTSYDYAHPEVQLNNLRALVSPSVLREIGQSQPDLEKSHANSIGDPTNAWLEQLDGHGARVAVAVSQTTASGFSPAPHQLDGLIECHLTLVNGSWEVRAFRWLQVPSPPESPAGTS